MADYDVIVVGAGNAALAAAVSAREAGAQRVLALEKAPQDLRGGNTHYSGALLRFAFDRPEDLRPLVGDTEGEAPGFLDEVRPYPAAAFWDDLQKVTEGRTDPALAEILISRSYATACWMATLGIRMEPAVSLAAVRVGGRLRWPAGAVVRAVSEGIGLSRMWFAIAQKHGVEVRYGATARRLIQDARGAITGVVVHTKGAQPHAPQDEASGIHEVAARSVVLGCGGFEANPEWRARYLGRPWDTAKVRGTRYNTGDGLRMALDVGALPHGQWTGCHGTPIAADAPAYGDRDLTDKTNRLSYPFGIVANRSGRRFLDEGEDFPLYTYAKLGGAILAQPGGVAFQIFDAKAQALLEPRYATSAPIVAETLEALAEQLPLDRDRFLRTVAEYNAAVDGRARFDPTVRDGLAALTVEPPKSNWAQRLDTPPFYAYPVTGGITFTFGGVRVDERAQVLSTDWAPLAGLYACGEMVGGLFHHNYPGGAGLMAGAVFGRIAGASAAADV